MPAKRRLEPEPPDIPEDLAVLTAEQRPDLADGLHLEYVSWTDGQLTGAKASSAQVLESQLDGVDLSGCELPNLSLRDVRIRAANLANLRARGGTINRVSISGSRLTGLLWAEGTIRDLRVTDCRGDLVALNGTNLQDVLFEDCLLSQSTFEDALLRGVRFMRCDLAGVDFRRARFTACEMHGCNLEGAAGITSLAGIAMPLEDVIASATIFANALGIKVLDKN
jgi:uncharacterized protein YjbI with pentapeptide repeats